MKEFKPLFEDCTLSPLYIAGPCSAESREQLLSAAEGMARAGVQIFRAGVWKPRTKPGSFEGVGAEALEWLKLLHFYQCLLFNNSYRENKVARTNVVDNIKTLNNLTEACVHAVEVLGVHAVVADEELRTTSVRATVCH